jgi:lysophospholipase L1-like esterase
LLALAGCGGGSGSGDGGDHRVIAAVGDSITAGNPGYDPDPAIRRSLGLGNNPESQWEWWAQEEHPELQIRNCGVRGQRTDEIAHRIDSCTQGADGVVIQGGINDLAQGIRIEAIAANLRGMVRFSKQLNLDVAVADVLPFNRFHPQADPLIAALNAQIQRIGQQEHVPVLPFHDTLEDPRSPGLMKAGFVSPDREHPSVAGYRQLGEEAFRPPGD